MNKMLISLCVCLLIVTNLHATQSSITEVEGYACMGDDRSRKQTEQNAIIDAKRKASDSALTYIKSESRVKDSELEKDLIEAYTNATVRIIQELHRGWYKDSSAGECFRIKIKAEVTPQEKLMEKALAGKQPVDAPSAPLGVKIWTDKSEYRHADRIKIYLKGNKPFYARVVYEDASGRSLQLLPNPYRADNYFNGGVVYEIPSGDDRFELEVSPPFGNEEIVVYASTSRLGDLNLESTGGVYQIKTKAKDIGNRTRSVIMVPAGKGKAVTASEFVEEKTSVKTGKR